MKRAGALPLKGWHHTTDRAGEKLFGEGLGNVPLVAKQLAKEALGQLRDGVAVIHVALGEAEGEELARVVDDHMQLESVEPAN